jgi:hypothetical protein
MRCCDESTRCWQPAIRCTCATTLGVLAGRQAGQPRAGCCLLAGCQVAACWPRSVGAMAKEGVTRECGCRPWARAWLISERLNASLLASRLTE